MDAKIDEFRRLPCSFIVPHEMRKSILKLLKLGKRKRVRDTFFGRFERKFLSLSCRLVFLEETLLLQSLGFKEFFLFQTVYVLTCEQQKISFFRI